MRVVMWPVTVRLSACASGMATRMCVVFKQDPFKKGSEEELWDLSVVEVGHLSLQQDDLMSGIRVDGVRVADAVKFSMRLDIETLKV